MNENEEITLSSSLERIKDAIDEIRESTNTTGQVIENVAQVVQNMSERNGLYTASSIDDMFAIQNPSEGDICIINNYQFTRYDPNIRTRMFYFPDSFTYDGEIEEFTDVKFCAYNPDGSIVDFGGTIYLTNGGGSSSSGSDSGSGSGSNNKSLCFYLVCNGTNNIPSFECQIFYTYDEESNIWYKIIPSMFKGVNFVNGFVLFPIDCIITRDNNQSLPSIIYEAIKLNKLEDFNNGNTYGIKKRNLESFDTLYLKKDMNFDTVPISNSTFSLNIIFNKERSIYDAFRMLFNANSKSVSNDSRIINANNGSCINIYYIRVTDTYYKLNRVFISNPERTEIFDYNTITNDMIIYLPFKFRFNTGSNSQFDRVIKNADTKQYHIYKCIGNNWWEEI